MSVDFETFKSLSNFHKWKHHYPFHVSDQLNLVDRIRWDFRVTKVQKKCVVYQKDHYESWELEFRWGDSEKSSEHIDAACLSCYEKSLEFMRKYKG